VPEAGLKRMRLPLSRPRAAQVYGHHNWPTEPLGTIAVIPGPVMAHVTEFVITIVGLGGHASQPHATIDPVVTAAQVCVTDLSSL